MSLEEVADTCTERPGAEEPLPDLLATMFLVGVHLLYAHFLTHSLLFIHSFNIQPTPLLCQGLDKVVDTQSVTRLDLQLSGDEQ